MRSIINRAMVVIQYLKSKNIPFYKKMIIIGCLIYMIYPMDLIPDYVIGMGVLDDVVALGIILLTTKSELDVSNKNDGYLNAEKSKKMFDKKKRKGK